MSNGSCPVGKPERWVHSQSKRPHSHDVRTLCVACLPDQDPVLVSGGNDAQLLVHSIPRYTKVGSYGSRDSPHGLGLRCKHQGLVCYLISAGLSPKHQGLLAVAK